MIDISGADAADGAWVVYQSSNDGGNAGEASGYDTISGFDSGIDSLAFLNANFAATDSVGTGAGTTLLLRPMHL